MSTQPDVTTGNFSSNVDVAGELTVAETIAHTGDTNNKISFPSADTITATTAGSERVRINSSGNVGLGGQTNPSATLHIQDLSANGYELKLSGNAITFNRTSLSYIDQINDTGSIVFRTTSSQTERLRIDSSGNILTSGSTQLFGSNTSDGSDNKAIMINGGGATSDSRGGYLIVHGNEHSSNPGITRLHAGNVGTAGVEFYTAGSKRVTIDSSGYVTKSAHPAFFAHMSASTNHDNGDYLKCNSVSEGVNTGGHYNTSNYRFTAPVTGVYLFFASANIVAGAGEYARSFQLRLFKDGNSQQFQMIRQTINGLTGSYPGTGSYSGIISLTKDEYVQMKIQWETDGSGFSTTESIHMHGTCFGGHLIG